MPRIAVAIQVQHQTAHRVGRAPAVVHDLAEARVAGFFHVLREGRQQVAKWRERDGVRADGGGQRTEYRVGRRFAAFDAVQFCQIGGQLGQPFGGERVTFVGDIVRAAGKSVDGFHRLAQPLGQQPGRNREVFVVIDRHRQ